MNPQFTIKYRKLLIVIPIIIALLMLIPLRDAHINPDLNAYFPEDLESRVNVERMNDIFGLNEMVIIILEADDVLNEGTLERLRNLTEGFSRMDEFNEVMSLFESKYIRGIDGSMVVDPVIQRVPTTPSQREALREEIVDNPFAYRLLVSDDFRFTLIMLNPVKGVPDGHTADLINGLLEEFPGDEKVYLNGMPLLKHEIQRMATRDLVILLPLGLIIMVVFLFLSFREFRGVLLPFSVVVMSIAMAMGLMPLLGYDLSIIAVLVPILMIAIANNYGVHIVARYQELNAKHPLWDIKRITVESIRGLSKPIVLTGLTTIVGVCGMVVHIMLPAKHMGIVSSVGIAFALILSLLFIPAVLSGMRKGKVSKSFTHNGHSWVDRVLSWVGRWATQSPRGVIYVFISVLLVLGVGASRLRVSINNENMMPESHYLRVSTNIANDHFGGTKFLSVLFEGDILEPEVMQAMDRFERELKVMPEVSNVTSLATVIRSISRALNEPHDPLYDIIPNDRMAIAQYMELYNMSGNPEDLEQMVNFEFTKAVLNVQFRARNIEEFNQVQHRIEELIAETPHAALMAGHSLVEKEMAQSIVRGQIYSLIFAFLAILLLMWIIFRAFAAGLIGSIPLVFTLICNFGLMGWLGFELDIATSLISSIAIGIGVDYTIHLFWRLKEEVALGRSLPNAITYSLSTTGRGIAINAFSVIVGFSVLFFSALTLLKSFALLIIFSLLLCLACALILVPAICMLGRMKFLMNNNHSASRTA